MQQAGKIGAWRHANAGKRFLDGAGPAHTCAALKYQHALACPRQVCCTGKSVVAGADYDYIPPARGQFMNRRRQAYFAEYSGRG
jgi:hypothetical protein